MASTSVTVERASPEERTSIRLTVKATPNKLRQATQGRATRNAGTRAAARRRPIVEETTSDDEEEDEDVEENQLDNEDEDEDAEGEIDEEMVDVEEEDDEEDDEDEDADADADADGDEDDEMEDVQPTIPLPRSRAPPTRPVAVPAPRPTIKTAAQPTTKAKPIQPESDDDELSSLGSFDEAEGDGVEDDEEDEDDEDEGGDEDAEGEEDIEGVGLDDELAGSDDDSLGSRGDTPDLTKLTRRQRADYDPSEMMALSNEAQKKKHLSAEEYAMRRAEMARRRKNLSEKRNEEEKVTFCSSIRLIVAESSR